MNSVMPRTAIPLVRKAAAWASSWARIEMRKSAVVARARPRAGPDASGGDTELIRNVKSSNVAVFEKKIHRL